MVLQLRTPGPSWFICVKEGGKGYTEHPSLVPVSVCEVTSSSWNKPMIFLHCLLLLFYSENLFLLSPTALATPTLLSFGHTIFSLHWQQYLCVLPMPPGPAHNWAHTFLYCLASKRIFLFSQAVLLPTLLKRRILDYLSSPNCGSRTTSSGF